MYIYGTPDSVSYPDVQQARQRLLHLMTYIPARLRAIPSNEFESKPSPAKWSKKEILGHLIDSATNNHQRFVRIQFEEIPVISYDGNSWVRSSQYQTMQVEDLIRFWEFYNRHLALLIERVPENAITRLCDSGDDVPRMLGWLIVDYVNHLEHHLHQLVTYD